MPVAEKTPGDGDHSLTVKQVIQKFGFSASKKLGQNFLLDPNIPRIIVEAAQITKNDTIIEVGPGPGALSQHILQSPAEHIILLEKDSQFLGYLQSLRAGRLHCQIQNVDALKVNWPQYAPFKIISNLPYNIGTELLVNWLSLPQIPTMVIMLQKEVADRLVAKPRTKAYGRLSILTQWLCAIEKICDVPPSCFWPAPKVTSTVVKLIPYLQPLYPAPRQQLEKLTALLFHQRRKMIRAPLLPLLGEHLEKKLSSLNLKSSQRPEELTIQVFCNLATLLG